MQSDTTRKWTRIAVGALTIGTAVMALVACGGDDGGGYAVAALAARTAATPYANPAASAVPIDTEHSPNPRASRNHGVSRARRHA